jgi:hypothetical protein
MEELLQQIITRLDRMEVGQQQLKDEVAAIKETMATKAEVTAIKETMATKAEVTAINEAMATKAEVAAIKETMATKDEVAAIKETMATKADITQLESKIESYGQVQQNDVYHLLKLTSEKIDGIREDMKSLVEITGEHEVRIRTLSRRPV